MDAFEAAAVLHDLEQSLGTPVVPPPAPARITQALHVADGALLAQAVLDQTGGRPHRLRLPQVDELATEPVRLAWGLMTERYTDLGVTVVCQNTPAVVAALFRIALEANGHPTS